VRLDVVMPTGGVWYYVEHSVPPPLPQSILFAYNVQQGGI